MDPLFDIYIFFSFLHCPPQPYVLAFSVFLVTVICITGNSALHGNKHTYLLWIWEYRCGCPSLRARSNISLHIYIITLTVGKKSRAKRAIKTQGISKLWWRQMIRQLIQLFHIEKHILHVPGWIGNLDMHCIGWILCIAYSECFESSHVATCFLQIGT